MLQLNHIIVFNIKFNAIILKYLICEMQRNLVLSLQMSNRIKHKINSMASTI